MGKPTAAEQTQLNLMSNIAEKLRNDQADQKIRDTALAMLLEVYVAERDLGLVSVTECQRFRSEYPKHSTWNAWKALTVLGSVATFAGAAIKIFA